MKNILDAGYKLPESIKKELIEEGIDILNIKLCTFIEEDKQSHLCMEAMLLNSIIKML